MVLRKIFLSLSVVIFVIGSMVFISKAESKNQIEIEGNGSTVDLSDMEQKLKIEETKNNLDLDIDLKEKIIQSIENPDEYLDVNDNDLISYLRETEN